ncbi:MAG: phosphomannomutase, partial [Proteobacteria bacterium]|nr:phosphomannomutase [Pseudomonadota bacterium]
MTKKINCFKAYDARGKVPDDLNEDIAYRIGRAYAEFIQPQQVAVGRVVWLSSDSLFEALSQGLLDSGVNVLDLGLCGTEMVYFATFHQHLDGGIMITASHNPVDYNGLKFVRHGARPISADSGLQDIRKYAAMIDPKGNHQKKGRIEKRDLWDPYREHVLSFLDLSGLRRGKTLRVVIDASNAMAGTMVPRIFGRKGEAIESLEIIELNFENRKGVFAHDPNPLVLSNLVQLQSAVTEHKADLGICFDGDADRCMVVDENADIIGCDLLTAWLAQDV